MGDSQHFAYAYIKTNQTLAQMPDEIYVLLTKEREETVVAHESIFNRILVRGQGDYEILGRYLADEEIGIDCLFHYRKYKKDQAHEGDICMMLETLDENVQFYHWNEFFDIATISDDDNFKARVSSFLG